ncbi:MAG: tetratricopeptide repeat protein [Cyanobacteria bacterium P01_D01_bin.156]
MKKDRWFDWTEYALLLGSGAGAIASVATQQALLAAAPLSLLAALGLISRRQLQAQLVQSQSEVHSMHGGINHRLDDLKEQVEDLPTHDYLRTIRQSIVAQNKQDLLSVSQLVEHTRKKLVSKIDEQAFPDLEDLQTSLVKLQERYTELTIELKDVKSRCQKLSDTSRIESTETMVSKLETELMQLRVHLDVLGANAKNTYAGFDDQLKYLSQQVQHLTTEEQQSMLKEEVQHLVKIVSDMASPDEFLRLSNQLMESTADKLILQELHAQASRKTDYLQQRLEGLEEQVGSMTNSVLEAVAETLEPLQSGNVTTEDNEENNDNQWLVDFVMPGEQSNSRRALEQLLNQSRERVVLVWPWSEGTALDDSLLKQFRQVLQRGCRLDIGWCHRGDLHNHALLRSVHQRWALVEEQQNHLKQALNQLLKLKQNYGDLFSFKILGATENFAISDTNSALVGMQALSTQISLFPTVNLKLRTTDPQVIQSLIQQFETPIIDAGDTVAYFNRGITHYDTSTYDAAVEDFTQVIRSCPSAAVYNWRGVTWVNLGDVAKALHDFDKAVRLDVRLFEAHCNRGVLRIDVRDYQGALSDLARAVELQPNNAIPYFYQGKVLQLLGNLPRALEQFSLAIERQPNLALPYCYRAIAYQKQGNIHQAVADLEIAADFLRHVGDFNNLEQVMHKLELLKQGPRLRTAISA